MNGKNFLVLKKSTLNWKKKKKKKIHPSLSMTVCAPEKCTFLKRLLGIFPKVRKWLQNT